MTAAQPGSPGHGSLDARTRQTLHDFLDFAATAARLVTRGREAYDGDEMLRLSGEAILHRIGEAVARLDDDFTAAHPDVRWRAMKGMRDLVAHDYGAVDHGILWNALTHSLPREADHVRRILDADR
ncbi:HepT-like ribonuclease domain-containing protein [Streptomyces sp. ST2-7A]|uniref:HepT-like ribonuclease domain-containing protein n=1 Tax=Streptomyces sp. ST2-7A TaxID=2907214 RepID=UPI001F25AF63|nr:HepT-like ribonuclease domain-containing protein [Streptomyces sp. ST2-7A]MCE7080891.1 DUF86 domain-containing protein [Streptomyces sp. ST2-7A]